MSYTCISISEEYPPVLKGGYDLISDWIFVVFDSVAYVSRSGGMSNELNNILSLNTDGVFEGVAIGGDR